MKPRLGPEVAQSNRNIRKMLRLAGTSRNDVFYDLGCGRAQLCIIAVTEFGVKRAVGIDAHRGRASKARRQVARLGLSGRIEVLNENFYDMGIRDATVVYNGLVEADDDWEFYEASLKKGCRLATLSTPLIGAMPSSQDYPFYLMRVPFRKARNVSEWISAVLGKKASLAEFLTEVDRDPDYWCDRRMLMRLIRKRFATLDSSQRSSRKMTN